MTHCPLPWRRVSRAAVVATMVIGSVACGDESDGDVAADQTTVVAVADGVGLVQATTDAVWVVTDEGLARIDPKTNTVLTTVEMDKPEYIVSDGSALWVSLFDANQLVRIDPATNEITDTLVVPGNPSSAVVVGNAIWVTSHRGAAVLRFERGAGESVASVAVGEPGDQGPLGLAAGMGSIWVGTPNIFTVSRIDPETNAVVAEYGIPPGANPCGDIAVADGRVQVSSCRVVPSIAVIDPESGAVQVVELEGLAVAVAVVDGQAWWAVQQPGDGTSQLVQLGRGSAPPTLVSVPGVAAIGGVVVAFDSIWVSDEANGTVTRLPMSLLG